MRVIVLTGLTMLACLGPGRAQEIKDPAEALPAKVVAYAECRQPGQFVKELVGLFENSALSDVPDSLFKLMGEGKAPPPGRGLGELGAAGLFLSPEVVKEAQRLQGAAAALTGFDDAGQPEYVVVILPGDSALPPLLFRTLLATAPVRLVSKVKGVAVYQITPPPARQAPGAPGAPPARSHEPALAMMPGALLIGSPGAVKDAIERIKGNKRDSLATSTTFRDVSKNLGDAPGIRATVDIAGVMAAVGQLPGLGQAEKQVLEGIGKFMNLKAFRSQSYSLTLEGGTLRYRELILLDPAEKSPILDLMPTEPLRRNLFHFTPTNAVAAVAMSNAGGAKRWASMLSMLDQVAKASGAQEVPSEEIGKIEKAINLDFGKDILGRIAEFGLALGDPSKAPVRRVQEQRNGIQHTTIFPETPVVLTIQATDEEAAGKLIEDVLPKLYTILTQGKEAKPTSKEIQGQKVHTLPGSPFWTINYGRQGKTIVLGPYADPVAQTLVNGSKAEGLLADVKIAAQFKATESPVVLGVARPFPLALGAMMVGVAEVRGGPPAPQGGKAPEGQKEEPRQREKKDEKPALPKELERLLASDSLIVLNFSHRKEQMLEEITWTGLKPAIGELTDLALKWYLTAIPARGGAGVQGRVLFQGQPLPVGTITFHAEGGLSVSGRIAEDGSYAIPSVPLGELRVTVTVPEPREGQPGRGIRIPAKYGGVQTSGLRITIREGRSSFDVDLK